PTGAWVVARGVEVPPGFPGFDVGAVVPAAVACVVARTDAALPASADVAPPVPAACFAAACRAVPAPVAAACRAVPAPVAAACRAVPAPVVAAWRAATYRPVRAAPTARAALSVRTVLTALICSAARGRAALRFFPTARIPAVVAARVAVAGVVAVGVLIDVPVVRHRPPAVSAVARGLAVVGISVVARGLAPACRRLLTVVCGRL